MADTAKKPYEKPELTRHGTVYGLTKGPRYKTFGGGDAIILVPDIPLHDVGPSAFP